MITKELINDTTVSVFQKEKYLIQLFLFCLFLAIINGYFFNWINDNYVHYVNTTENGLKDFSYWEKFSIAVIIGPICETGILQYTPNKILEKLKVKSEVLKILLPSVLFGLCHFYSLIYVVMTFFSALVLNAFYIKSKSRSSWYFILTALLHSLYNLYGYLFVK
ncbi:CPBP family intramembrane glutamic endopeptidase [Flavobacterium branchiicola]|uniref:CPBP family intramembrane glutamic endopeptidase n=1 Tax=Flavobacterium branchiicola TaxID=1114875 RepID=A0ABV9PBN5_9FLAO|nr:CPBP family intramembrane glutamic endopeptidase [Flavobacterium branchiicola]MBS7254028.1 CPBP family intramembrane metalloprotease [Flavobacterium branchiicola]